jgi:lipopolysaccharide/colanic/teichoic acid biosynthesis glycosyltransferase
MKCVMAIAAGVIVIAALLAWIFLVMAVAVGTGDKGKTASTEKKPGTSTEKIEILRARPVPITTPSPHFMRPHFIPMGRDDARI